MSWVNSSAMSVDNIINEVISTCWDRIVQTPNTDSIYVTQVLRLISEIETAIQITSLFVPNEIRLLDSMIQSKPTMRLYKQEVKEFLIRLVHFPNFEIFLRERFGISAVDLQSRYSKLDKPYKEFPDLSSRVGQKTRSSYSLGYNPPSPPYSPPIIDSKKSRYPDLNNKDYYVEGEVRRITSGNQERQIQSLTFENSRLYKANRVQEQDIQDYKTEVASLKKYVKSLETQISYKPDMSSRRLLDREKTIRNLDKLCRDHSNELERSKQLDQKNRKQINEMVNSINQQDKLIMKLQASFDLNEPLGKSFKTEEISSKVQGTNRRSRMQEFLINLPFLKQYYAFFKYKQDSKNIGLTIVNITTLLLGTFVLTNILKVILFGIVWALNGPHSESIYVYDNYGTSWFSTKSTFVWWKEIEWVEVLVYKIEEWWG